MTATLCMTAELSLTVRPSIHRSDGRSGVTAEIRALLECNPGQAFTLRDIMTYIRVTNADASKEEINSALCKLVERNTVDQGSRHRQTKLGPMNVNIYRWNSDGGQP